MLKTERFAKFRKSLTFVPCGSIIVLGVIGLKQKELAAMLGVSESTVAKALRDSDEISLAVRERIHAEAVRLGYKKAAECPQKA